MAVLWITARSNGGWHTAQRASLVCCPHIRRIRRHIGDSQTKMSLQPPHYTNRHDAGCRGAGVDRVGGTMNARKSVAQDGLRIVPTVQVDACYVRIMCRFIEPFLKTIASTVPILPRRRGNSTTSYTPRPDSRK